MDKSMIHATAVIEPGVDLGKDVSVGPFSYLQSGASIGDGCVIGPHVTVFGPVAMGAECQVHAGAVLGDLPQDLGFKNEATFVSIGARCVIRECVTIHRATKAGEATEVGDECFLMACSHLAHDVKLGARCILANGALLGGHVHVGERVFISANCGVHQFVRIGRLAMLGGNSGISKDVPPFCTVRTVGFNEVAGLNLVGLRRAGLADQDRADIQQAFRMLYLSGLNTSQAVEKIKARFAGGPALEFVEFIAGAKRGICAGPRESASA